MTILGSHGGGSVEDRAAECLSTIARTFDEGMAHLDLLARRWLEPRPVEDAEPVVPAADDEADQQAEDEGEGEGEDEDAAPEPVHVLFADAATDQIPVQAAA